MFLPFRMVSHMYALTRLSSVAAIVKYASCFISIEGLEYLLLSKGYKSALYLWERKHAVWLQKVV